MKMRSSITLIASLIIMILSSCVSKKELIYLKYSEKYNDNTNQLGDARTYVAPTAYKVMFNDILLVRVLTPDPQWSALFNLDAGQGGLTQESAALSGYPVDLEGNIEIPFVGKVKVAGKTLSEIKAELELIFENYVADASIIVRLVDSYISIIGEVSGPGRYPITKDHLNIFEALAMAHDLSVFSNRQRVQLIRPSPYGPVVKEFSLADRSILTSEFYYVMPNDVIYAMPLKGKAFQTNSSVYTLFLTTITTALVIISYFQRL